MAEESSEMVLLRRFHDPTSARMTFDFLRDSGILVELRGDTPDVVRNLYSPIDIRIVVPANQLAQATEALEAFTAEATLDDPFRSVKPPETEEDGEPMPPPKKYWPFATALAFLGLAIPPLGGAGHFYAHHNAMGIVFAVANTLSMLLAFKGLPMTIHFAIVIVDSAFSFFAVRRYARREIPDRGAQINRAIALVLLATVVGFVASTFTTP